jgi:hypothetical protein
MKSTIVWFRSIGKKAIAAFKWIFGISSALDLLKLIIAEVLLLVIWSWLTKMWEETYIQAIGYIVLLLGGLFAFTWYVTKTALVRATAKPYMQTISYPRLEQGGVIWEDHGFHPMGGLRIVGPFMS